MESSESVKQVEKNNEIIEIPDSEEQFEGIPSTSGTNINYAEINDYVQTIYEPLTTVEIIDEEPIDIQEFEEEIDPEAPSTSSAASTSTSSTRKKPVLNQYNKKIILKVLKEFGAGEAGLAELNKRFHTVPREEITQFINKQAALSSYNVKEQCLAAGIKEFTNIESWIDVLKSQKLKEESKSEIAMIFKAIAETESHMEIEEAEGIDFRKLYRFLSEVMIGHPSTAPEGPTADFLQEVFDEVMEEARNDTESLEKMKAKLKENVKGRSLDDDFHKSIDPFLLKD
ncbi:hypothetical protein ACFFRR_003051 [Megaselia abdita]